MKINKVPVWLLNASSRIIEHMNDNHSGSIYLFKLHNMELRIKVLKWKNLKIKSYFASFKGKSYFLKFGKSCYSSEEYKIKLIQHAKKYKQYEL